MARIFVGRHAYAGTASNDPKRERERPLTDEGVATAQKMAAAVIATGDIPKVIFCSPFVRTQQTADIYGKAFTQARGDRVSVNAVGDFAPQRPLDDAIYDILKYGEIKGLMLVLHVDNSSPAFRRLAGCDEKDDSVWPDLVMGEVRRLKIDRKSLAYKVKWAIAPSDIGRKDYK